MHNKIWKLLKNRYYMEIDQNSDIIPFTFQLTELANCMERVCFCVSSCASLVEKINLFLERESIL